MVAAEHSFDDANQSGGRTIRISLLELVAVCCPGALSAVLEYGFLIPELPPHVLGGYLTTDPSVAESSPPLLDFRMSPQANHALRTAKEVALEGLEVLESLSRSTSQLPSRDVLHV